ncbi:Potassium/sodium hyperpolarization-activated cyclic nucleotide-gated channel 1 [Triplophysa tibetana]|uniref:Potassium/sodium hyperpolarization-activated cyclic nucleotide-gated channel 1 n=1 Tax=Triplophysa tibetana TaxID=1572043 RepID=A0A5A9P516_9TELE|nr:Potassium/sodium hyperpolarization-activated cyclic nucleotide-gated channel 1 [Triplophysa tibetana]
MESLAPENHRHFGWSSWRNLLLPQLNRRSLYIYGSEVAVERECIRQKKEAIFVIHPFSLFRSYYIMCMVAITFLNLIGIPMEIAFLDGNSGVGWEGFNVFSDTLFLIDVGLNFRMGIIDEDSEGAVLDLKRIRQHYLKSWFVPDMVAAFPVGYILLIAVMRIVQHNGCTELPRSKEKTNLSFFHLSLQDLQYHGDSPSSRANKMMRILMFVRILSLVRLLRVSRLVRFFNEVERVDDVELWIVMTSIVSGALMYTVMVANTAALMSDVDITSRAYKNKMNHLEDYMTFMKLPKDLRMRITNYFQARYAGKWYDEKDVLKWVSSSLRENRDINFINNILMELQYEVYQEGEIIILKNTPGDRMFFIEHGQVLEKNEFFERELCDGDYFGESCLITKERRLATVQAQTDSQLFSLSVDCFRHVLQDYPEIKRDLESPQQDKDLLLF